MKILFIGNSYTDQIQKTFRQMVAASSHKEDKIEVIWGGGATLKRLIDNGRAFNAIASDKWDYVIIQEQSVKPAIPGPAEESFHESVDALVKKIRESGAKPVLYMTWGRLDGLKNKKELFPDYLSMQEKLSNAYSKAGKKNNVPVAPVGEVWSLVRNKYPELGKELYQRDGSHPSVKGAYIASCIFFKLFYGDKELATIEIPKGMNEKECEQIREIVAGISIE